MKKNRIDPVFLLGTIVLLVGSYFAFFWGRKDYLATKQDTKNAQAIIEMIKLLPTQEISSYEVLLETPVDEREMLKEPEAWEYESLSEPPQETQGSISIAQRPKINNLEEALQQKGVNIDKPDGARGYIEFILNYPQIHLVRGVYTSENYSDIDYDLNHLYLLTTCVEETASNNTTLGKTAVVIQGHNSLRKDLAMNRLLEAEVGQTFELIGYDGIYEYQVTQVYAMNRARSKLYLMENIRNLDSRDCYLITCGRNTIKYQFRYQNMIVKGVLLTFIPYESD